MLNMDVEGMGVEEPPIGDEKRLMEGNELLRQLLIKGTIDARFSGGLQMFLNVWKEVGENQNPNNIPDDQTDFILGRHIEGTIQKQLRIYQVLKHYEDIVSDGEKMKEILDILIDLSGKLDKLENENTYKKYKKNVTDEINNKVLRVLPGIRKIYDDFVGVKIPVHSYSLFHYYDSGHMDEDVKDQYELFKNDAVLHRQVLHRQPEPLEQALYSKCDNQQSDLSREAITALFSERYAGLEGGRRRQTRSRKKHPKHKKTARRRKNRYRKRSKTIKRKKTQRKKRKTRHRILK